MIFVAEMVLMMPSCRKVIVTFEVAEVEPLQIRGVTVKTPLSFVIVVVQVEISEICG
jgi:hypothetical protein